MIRQLIHRLFAHRHFWRDVDFGELSEIYVSTMFRSLSVSMTSIFVPLYLLRLGNSFTGVVCFFLFYFVFRGFIFDYIAGWMTAKLGPKHTMLYSYGLLIMSTLLFLTLPDMHWPIWLLAAVWAAATSVFSVPFNVDFSKVKHKAHGGKELGYVNIMEKFGGVAGPILGGVVATLFGGQYIFMVSVVMLVLAGVSLLRTSEPVRTGQKLALRSLKLGRIKRDLIAYSAYGIELTLCNGVWSLYLAIFIVSGTAAYAGLGILASASVVAAMLAAFSIGRLIDKRKGKVLLQTGAILNAALHLFRPLVNIFPVALLVNIANEGISVAYRIPFMKGMYDAADDLPERRIAYFTIMEIVASMTKLAAWVVLLLLALVYSPFIVMTTGFVMAAIASLLIMTERFKALDI